MQFSSKNRIAYFAALTLLFSYIEMLLPKVLPFLRLGLSNIPVLLAFDLPFLPFMFLTFIKSFLSAMMQGTLFSPFVFVSLSQSLASAFLMFFLSKLRGRFLSIYGISIAGSAVSALVQILTTSLYLGKGTFSLLPYMLFFSLFSGIITAFLAQFFNISQEPPLLNKSVNYSVKKDKFIFAKILFLLCAFILIFTLNNIYFLLCAMFFSFALQIFSKRKIFILPHLSMWLFVILTSLIVPEGKILFSLGKWSLTQGALLCGIKKSIKLSSVMALSQWAATFNFEKNNFFISKVLSYHKGLLNKFNSSNGNIINRLKVTLSSKDLS